MTQDAYEIEGADRPGPWLVTCDHAVNLVPEGVNGGNLGLPRADMARHIAYDPGAMGVARALGGLLDAPVIWARFSRLVIDPNRGLDDPTLLMKLYDGTIIPANARADSAERQRRIETYWQPYHDAYARLAARPGTLICAIHSFTPQLQGRAQRPWELGVLSSLDRRLADPLIAAAGALLDTPVGDNVPYGGHLPGDSIDRHALRQGRPNALIELRQDVIATPSAQRDWAARLAKLVETARQTAGL